jgi:glutamine transport system substrate-binding protein
MTKKRILVTIIALLSLSVFLMGCGSSNGSKSGSASKSDTILVGADTTFPPFESEQGGNVVGFDIDMIKAIAKKEGIKVEQIKTMPFDGIIPALQGGTVDIGVAGITIKKSRMDTVNFSDAYYKSGLSILVKKNSGINSLADLKGKLIATKKATSSVDYLTQNGFKDSDIKQFADIDTAYAALESGGAQAVVFDNPVNINFATQHSDVHTVGGLLTGEYYGIAISKKKPELVKKINDGLQKIKADGTYAKLFDKYLGGDKNGMVNDVKKPADIALKDK